MLCTTSSWSFGVRCKLVDFACAATCSPLPFAIWAVVFPLTVFDTWKVYGVVRSWLLCFILLSDTVTHDPCYLQEFWLHEFSKDCLELWFHNQVCKLEIVPRAWLEVSWRVPGFLLQGLCPQCHIGRLLTTLLLTICQCDPHGNIQSSWS